MTSTRYLRHRLICSTLIRTAAPASIQALPASLAIIDRGVCTFSQKVANAKAAGAVAVIIVNNVAGDPTRWPGRQASMTIFRPS